MDIASSTQQEIKRMIAGGMQQISAEELKSRITALGYKFYKDMSMNYVNRHNAIPYKARHVSYMDTETGLGWAHKNARRDARFQELQKIRFHCFVVNGGRIWEL